MKAHHCKILSCLFVGIMMLLVKGAEAKSSYFDVISTPSSHVLELKKVGLVRLSGILYEPFLDSSEPLQNIMKGVTRVKVDRLSKTSDRYGRKNAQLYLKDGRWLQGELVRQGWARPYPLAGETQAIRDLYLLEKIARQSNLGHWADKEWKIISALAETIPKGSFQMIEGVVVAVAQVKGKTYLNFGHNWRRDFTVMLTKKDLKKFREKGFDLPILKGKRLRVRGWVFEKNGPMIRAEHPLQFQLLD